MSGSLADLLRGDLCAFVRWCLNAPRRRLIPPRPPVTGGRMSMTVDFALIEVLAGRSLMIVTGSEAQARAMMKLVRERAEAFGLSDGAFALSLRASSKLGPLSHVIIARAVEKKCEF